MKMFLELMLSYLHCILVSWISIPYLFHWHLVCSRVLLMVISAFITLFMCPFQTNLGQSWSFGSSSLYQWIWPASISLLTWHFLWVKVWFDAIALMQQWADPHPLYICIGIWHDQEYAHSLVRTSPAFIAFF